MQGSDVQQLIAAAVQQRRAGNAEAAAGLFRQVLEQGEHPMALNALALHELAQARFADAEALIRRAIVADSAAPDLWMNLARVHREQGDDDGEAAALHGALALDQRHFMATVRMAELCDRRGDAPQAAERWSGVLAMAAQMKDRTPALESLVERARTSVGRQHQAFAAAVDAGLADMRETQPAKRLRRFDACIDHALGRREIYTNRCTGLHFPFLPADEFFDRDHFPWLAEIEGKTDAIRAELEAALGRDAPLRPYIAMPRGTPTNKWSPLDHSLDWGAMHLWKDGRRDDAVCARFPVTAAAVEALPLSDMPRRTPTVFFSLLRPGAHLPAHTGVSNVRSIVHLPLIVPSGCAFRVGGETREWRVGEAFVFDDTIDHEAWNRSDQLRAILIFDVWNPHLTADERELLREFYRVSAASSDAPATIAVSE